MPHSSPSFCPCAEGARREGGRGTRTNAAFRDEPPFWATRISTLGSQMHLGVGWGAADYMGFAVCLGQRRTLEMEGAQYEASSDKTPGMQQKKGRKEIYGRRRTLLIALVKSKRGGRKHDVSWQGRKSSQN